MSRRTLILSVVGLTAAALPLVSTFWTFVATLAVVYALTGLGLVVLTGWTGQLNLHIAALGLGWGAYASYALQTAGASPLLALLAAPVLTVPFSIVVGLVAVRFRGLELAVATLAIGLTFEQLVFRNLGSWLGGASAGGTPFESSFVSVARPSIGGWSLQADRAYYLFALALGAIALLALHNTARLGTQRTTRALREREVAAEVLGIPALRYRIGAFVASISLAGLGGALFAALKVGVAPDSFSLDLSFLLLAGVVVGGIRSLAGGVLGGALAAALPEIVRFGPLELLSGERLVFLFGVAMIVTLAIRPQGLLGRAPAAHLARRPSRERPSEPVDPRPARSGGARMRGPAAVRADGVTVRFGGVHALEDVDLAVPRGEICALIGPNGAGKTTLFNVLSGVVRPDAGRVYLGRDDVTHMAPHRRAALGLGRTFQSVELVGGLTARENLMAAAHLRRTAGPIAAALALPAAVRSERRLAVEAATALGGLGPGSPDAYPSELSTAEQRRLELGCALALGPVALLLDEPTAGLDPAESQEAAERIRRLRDELGLSVLLVEHDMAVVGRVADWVYVLDFGRVIAQGPPDAIRRDPHVVARYLGEPERAHARST